MEEGLCFQRAGRLSDAAKSYRQVLAEDPAEPDALHFMGVLAQQLGNLDDAVDLIAESLRIKPENTAAINNLAGVLKDQQRYPEALEFYQAAVAASPLDAYLHSNTGNVLKELGRLDEAAARYSRAIELDPQSYAAHSNLGTVFKEQGRLADAADCYERAIELNAESPEALSNLGVVLKEQGRFEAAAAALERALALNPNSDAAWTNLGSTVKELGRPEEALAHHCRALELNPRSFFAHNNLGTLLKDQGRFTEAVGCFEKSIALNPNFFLAHNNLGSAFCELGRAGDAIECFRRSVELKPGYHAAFSNLLFTLNYLGTDRARLFAEHRRFDEIYGEPLRGLISLHPNSREPERPLRVGFVSGDLREHPVASFIEPVFALHAAEECEFFCYSNHPHADATTARLRSKVEHWREVAALSDEQIAELVRRDRIDILVDLSGHTARNRLLVFARKPAPIQVSMIGYMQTTGLHAMDYRITDEHLDPVGVSDPFNVEKLVRLPAGAAPFQPPADSPPVSELPALANGFITFGSFNNLAKVSPEALGAWAEILHAVPDSRLLLVGREGNGVLATLADLGIAKERVEMIPRQSLGDYLRLHHRVDVLLDSFPYNGGTTSLLALWMGVPFVTLAGESTTGRAGAGILQGVGLTRLVTHDVPGYVRTAIQATEDIPSLAALRQTLRAALLPSLQDSVVFTSQMEAAFRQMWRQWCGSTKG